MTTANFRPSPSVYLLTASRAHFAAVPGDNADFEQLLQDLRHEGFVPRIVHAPDTASSLAALVETLPLEEMTRDRPRTVAFIYWFGMWEGLQANGSALYPKINAGNSVIRNILIQRFRGTPFLTINVDPLRLAEKWGVNLKGAERPGSGGVSPSDYFARKFGAVIRELNQGMILAPFPEQLQRSHKDAIHQKELARLLQGARRLGINADTLARALAQAFPEGEPVEIRKCMGGMSGALVFVAKARGSAPKLVKLCSWHDAQCEYEGARFVIGPRLTNFAAVTITPGNDTGPSLFTEGSGDDAKDFGMLVYAIVGTPGGELNIRSLDELIADLRNDPARVTGLLPRLEKTLDQVLGQLHGQKPATLRRTLWGWLGRNLPPLYSLDLEAQEENPDRNTLLPAYASLGFKPDTAALLAEASWRGFSDQKFIELQGAVITGIKEEEIVVAHPDLGFQIICRGDIASCLAGAGYLKIGHPVKVRGRVALEMAPWLKPQFLNERLGESEPVAFFCPAIRSNEQDPIARLPLSLTFEGRVGAIHGDLNLNNIQFSDETNLGWLIDFDRSVADGLIAFDFAKLEIELVNHHLIPALLTLSKAFPTLVRADKPPGSSPDRRDPAKDFLMSVLRTLDAFHGHPQEIKALWRTMAHEVGIPIERFEPGSLAHLEALLCVLAVIRTRANLLLRTELRKEQGFVEPPADLALALSVYALTAIKFADRAGNLEHIGYLDQICKHYWAFWGLDAPPVAQEDDLEWRCRTRRAEDLRNIDRYLFTLSRQSNDLASIIAKWQGSAELLEWDGREAWDVASTGCVANISPIIGYLWLMARRKCQDPGGIPPLVVPKISSSGTSCGTVDILEAGGYRFPDSLERIKRSIATTGGVFCKQDETRVRIDKVTMERRKKRNLMKNPMLVLASILTKKTLMGCTHGVIDIKIGRDTKLVLGDDANSNRWLCSIDNRQEDLLPGVMSNLARVLERYLGKPTSTTRHCLKYVKESGIAGTSVKELRILCSSADVPQGRALGRLLILIQLDRVLDQERPFADWPDKHKRFYLHVLKEACGVPKKTSPEALRTAWQKLKEDLPIFQASKNYDNSDLLAGMQRVIDTPSLGYARPVLEGRSNPQDLHVLVVPSHQTGRIDFIDAYALDGLFETICGDDGDDIGVGFWLHRLPGETVSKDEPLLSIIFRPAIMGESILRRRMQEFLTSSVRITHLA